MLDRFECARDGCGADIDVVGGVEDGGHEGELVDVEVAEALAKGESTTATFVCELAREAGELDGSADVEGVDNHGCQVQC